MNTFDPAKLGAAQDDLREFNRIHAAQAGFIGSITVDLGGGREFVMNVWQSAEDADAGMSVLGPHVGRLLSPLMAAASEFIGAGPVVDTDFAPTRQS
ncbi:hypothetical protein [Sinomonas sp. P10A9]|uniref:ABM domain-containing protein n=1 Tax=Sinomonas puerhi TaxID=3238584 RepID=A0AB39L378_9MICC